jgi:hypothetical protein
MKTSDVGNSLSESEHSFTIAAVRSVRPPSIEYQHEQFGKIYQQGFSRRDAAYLWREDGWG